MNTLQILGILFTVLGVIMGSIGTYQKNHSNKEDIKSTIKEEVGKVDSSSKEKSKERITDVFYKQKETLDKQIQKLHLKIPQRMIDKKGIDAISAYGLWGGIIVEAQKKGKGKAKDDIQNVMKFLVNSQTQSFEDSLIEFMKTYLNLINDKSEKEGYILDPNERKTLASLFTANYSLKDLKFYFNSRKAFHMMMKEKPNSHIIKSLDTSIRKSQGALSLLSSFETIANQ